MAVVKTVHHTENPSHVFICFDLLFLSVLLYEHDGWCGGGTKSSWKADHWAIRRHPFLFHQEENLLFKLVVCPGDKG